MPRQAQRHDLTRDAAMKVAFITPVAVLRPGYGFELRLFQVQALLRRIAAPRFATCELATHPLATRAGVGGTWRLPALATQYGRDLVALALHVLPWFTVRSLGSDRDRILAWVEAERPTHVVLVHPYATELVPDLRARGVAAIVDCHNVESDVAGQLASAATGAARVPALLRRQVLLRRERLYLPAADEVWLPSPVDVARQQRVCRRPLRARCVPNALDLDSYRCSASSYYGAGDAVVADQASPTPRAVLPARRDIVLPGSFAYAPNVEGARLLRDRILPAVRASVPEARLLLVGQDPDGHAAALQAPPAVVATGAVPDTRPYLRAASVVAVPVLHGGGTRFKILEALALGRPVVTTPLGCEGLDVEDGRHLLVRPIDEFAGAIFSLLRDPARGDRLGRRGRALVEQQYSWEAVEAALRDGLRAAGRRRQTAYRHDAPVEPA
jgi:polysaccharide biosynthesis protein PslH